MFSAGLHDALAPGADMEVKLAHSREIMMNNDLWNFRVVENIDFKCFGYVNYLNNRTIFGFSPLDFA